MSTLTLIASMGIGLIVGSFLSMLIPRLHEGKKGIVMGRSECPKCQAQLTIRDLIPLFSYLFYKGRCAHCKKSISKWYPFTELLSLLAFLFLGIFSPDWATWGSMAPIVFTLLFIFIYDLRYQEIHDAILLPGILYAAVWASFQGSFVNGLWGAGIAFIFFGGQWLISRGRWLGSGDIVIGIFLGLILGWEKMSVALFFSYILGSVVGLLLLATRKAETGSAVPLGPFLVAGTVLTWVCGDAFLSFFFLQP